MTCPYADELLYDIGLSFDSLRDDHKKRRKLYYPLVIMLINMIMCGQKVAGLLIKDGHTLIAIGCYGHFYGINFHANMAIIFASIFIAFCMTFNYINHRRKIRPTFLRLFQVILSNFNHDVTSNKISFNFLRLIEEYIISLDPPHPPPPTPSLGPIELLPIEP